MTAPQSTTTNGSLARGLREVDRAREHVLAGARLALEEHRRVGRRDALEHAEDRAHREALADGRTELGACSEGSTSTRASVGSNHHLDLAEPEDRAGRGERLGDFGTRDAGPVGRAEVLDRRRRRCARSISQWWRETVSSGSTRSLSGALPTRTRLSMSRRLTGGHPGEHEQREVACRAGRAGRQARGDGSIGLHLGCHRSASRTGKTTGGRPGYPANAMKSP